MGMHQKKKKKESVFNDSDRGQIFFSLLGEGTQNATPTGGVTATVARPRVKTNMCLLFYVPLG